MSRPYPRNPNNTEYSGWHKASRALGGPNFGEFAKKSRKVVGEVKDAVVGGLATMAPGVGLA